MRLFFERLLLPRDGAQKCAVENITDESSDVAEAFDVRINAGDGFDSRSG